MTGTLGRRGSLPASPSRVEGCIFGLLSGVDVPVRVHQLLRSSLSFDEFGESRHVELKTILFTFMLQYIYQECGCILTADQLSYLWLYVSYHSHCMHGSRPWIREPAPSDPAHVRYVNTYRELEHFLIHFLICSYLLNYHVNPTQVLGCLAVRIARIWITSQMIRHWLGHVMWYLRDWGRPKSEVPSCRSPVSVYNHRILSCY